VERLKTKKEDLAKSEKKVKESRKRMFSALEKKNKSHNTKKQKIE